jgi:hypothetical protein
MRDALIVDDAGFRDVNRPHAGTVRLDFAQPLGPIISHRTPFWLAAAKDVVEGGNVGIARCDNDFAADIKRNILRGAKLFHAPFAFRRQFVARSVPGPIVKCRCATRPSCGPFDAARCRASFSRTTTERSGKRCDSSKAVASPTMPPQR